MTAPEQRAELAAGDTLGRYELLAPVASGGMAKVWAARLRGTRGFQKIVAVKTMLASLRDDASFEQMFLAEATLASRVHHPHVAEILDLGEESGVLYLVMEWVDGESLADLLGAAAERGGVPVGIAVRIAMQACAGLHAAHELRKDDGELVGLVHRDVSPQNILVTLSGVTKVVDFGIAAVASTSSMNVELRGKAAYAAPEQVFDGAVDRRTDVFALGIVLYEMIAGAHPFAADNELATMAAITSPEPPPSPRSHRPDVPEALERIVMRALAKDPADRYPTASDMLRELDLALPATERASTDEDVAAYVGSVRGAEHEAQRAVLAEALRAAPEAEAEARPAPQSGQPPPRRLQAGIAALAVLGLVTFLLVRLGARHDDAPRQLARETPPVENTTAAPAATASERAATGAPSASVASAEPAPTGSTVASATSTTTRKRNAPASSATTFRSPVRTPGF